jgi:hypothetical protein
MTSETPMHNMRRKQLRPPPNYRGLLIRKNRAVGIRPSSRNRAEVFLLKHAKLNSGKIAKCISDADARANYPRIS